MPALLVVVGAMAEHELNATESHKTPACVGGRGGGGCTLGNNCVWWVGDRAGGWTESTDEMVRTMNAAFLSVVDCVFCVTPVCFVNASSLHCLPEALQTLSQDCPLPPRTQSCRLGGDISCLRTRSLPMMAEIMSYEVVALKMVYEKKLL